MIGDWYRRAWQALRPPSPPRRLEEVLPAGEAIFLHRPHGQLHHGITPEVVEDFEQLSRWLLAGARTPRYSVPPEVTLVTYNTRPVKSRLERCCDALGVAGLVVLGQSLTPWDWGAKVKLVLDYLESGRCTTRYLVATDADDVLIANDPATLLDRFRSYACDVLFCNTFVDWPPHPDYRDFETLRNYRYPFHCRLSAGGYVGERGALLGYLRELFRAYEKREAWATFHGGFDDQLGWRALHHRDHPKIQVDTRCRIFKRYDIFRDCLD